MHHELSGPGAVLALVDLGAWLYNFWMFLKVLIGFSIIIFVHELGHFLAAKWVGVRVDRFAVGFGSRLCGWRRGEGFTFGNRPNYTADELREKNYGETDYCFKALPIGGYVKMLGHDDVDIDEKTGEIQLSKDPRAFVNRPVGQRMIVVSAGVIFNLLFAALLLMGVFLVGKRALSPVVGRPIPGGPAHQAGVLAGDRVVEINGEQINTYRDIVAAEVLSDGLLRVKVRRVGGDGQPVETTLDVTPEWSDDRRARSIGITPMVTPQLDTDAPALDGPSALKGSDRIVAVNGQRVVTSTDVELAILRSESPFLRFRVARPDPKNPNAPPQELPSEFAREALLEVGSAEAVRENFDRAVDARHILGLLQRRQITEIKPGSAAQQAGLLAGDVVLKWGERPNPLWSQIKESVEANAGKPVPVTVRRQVGNEYKELELTVTSRRPFQFWGTAPAQVGIICRGGETREPVVAEIVDGTPAAVLKDKGLRGARIQAIIDGDKVVEPRDWFEVVAALKAAAGRTVKLKYNAGGNVVEGELAVPSSIVNELKLQPGTIIQSVTDANGKVHDRVTLDDGSTAKFSSLLALRKWLKDHIGETVKITYVELQPSGREGEEKIQHTKEFAVRADNVDPWQFRLNYTCDLTFTLMTEIVTAHGNPLRALWMGVKSTYNSVMEAYHVLRQMAKRNVSTENVSGPIGIFGQAIEQAKEGWGELLYFLAFLSANLAVINFLPLPLVDGGLMLFLLLEKIRGKPLSIKTQMITTLVGLALILLCFLLVTIQDVTRLFR